MAITLHMKNKTFFFVFLMISFAFLLIIQQETTSASTTTSSSSSSSAQALLKWKTSLINSTGSILDSWSDVTNPCNWTGTQCDNYFEIIVGINVSFQSLNGTLDEFDFSAFPNLTYLALNDNSLFGEIPIQIGSLSKLTSLYLNDNYFTVNLVVFFVDEKLPELLDRTNATLPPLLPLSSKDKDSRTKEEHHRLLNGNSGDTTDWRLRA